MSRLVSLVVICLLFAGAGLVAYYYMRPAPPAESEAAAKDGVFREAALESGLKFKMNFLPTEQGTTFKINLYDHGAGVAVGDFDGDGHEDVYFCNQLGPNALYRNRGDGTFEDVTTKAGVALGDRICTAATFADYDNDGRPDLFVTSTRGGNVLYHNLGNGTFKDVTKEAGLTHVGHSQMAVFFDFDNDGLLDLYVLNTAQWTNAYDSDRRYYPGKTLTGLEGGLIESPKEHNILYRNNGDGTFTDVTAKAGLAGRGWSSDVAVFDYDGDGRLDVLVVNMFGPAQLYRNNGNGTFTDVTAKTLGRTSGGGTGARAFDFNNDGKLDLFIVDMHSDMWMGLDIKHDTALLALRVQHKKFATLSGPNGDKEPAAALESDRKAGDLLGFKPDEVVWGNSFFKNLGGGKFEEKSDRAGLETLWPWGIGVGDFDNDGYEDVFIPSGMGYPFYYWPNQLLMNEGNETFSERGVRLGISPPARGFNLGERINGREACRSSRAVAVADFDGDGRLDLVVNNFNDHPYYFRNGLPRQNYVAFRLRGTASNRDAIGALVHLYTGKEVMTRQVNPAGGYLSQSSKTIHFGLGTRARADRVEIQWPSGRKQVIDNPELNRLHDVVEPG